MSVHNSKSLSCLSSLSLPAFASLLPLPLCLTPSFPSQVWPCCLSWHSCGRDPLGMVRLGALVCKESWKWMEEVVRVPARLGKAGSFPHAHLGPGHLCRWPQPGLLLLENGPSGKLLAWDQASTHTIGSLRQLLVPGPSAGQPWEPSSHKPGPGRSLGRSTRPLFLPSSSYRGSPFPVTKVGSGGLVHLTSCSLLCPVLWLIRPFLPLTF